jgi:hypothetical protein
MVAKALWASILVVGLLALGGLGYSAVTLKNTVSIAGSSGTWSTAFTGDFTYLNDSSAGYVTGIGCSGPASGSDVDGSTLAVTATNMAPGDWCEVFGNISNTGSVPITLVALHIVLPGSCFQWNVEQPTSVTVLNPGDTLPFQITLELGDHAASCQSVSGTFSTTFVFYVGAGEHGEPLGV